MGFCWFFFFLTAFWVLFSVLSNCRLALIGTYSNECIMLEIDWVKIILLKITSLTLKKFSFIYLVQLLLEQSWVKFKLPCFFQQVWNQGLCKE